MTQDLPARFLSARRAFLGTCSADGRPHVVPVCFAVQADRIYIAIDEKPKSGRPLRRLRNLAENPRATLTADHYSDDWQHLWWVMVQGAASVLGSGAQRADALAALRAKYAQYETMDLEARPLIELEVERVLQWQASP